MSQCLGCGATLQRRSQKAFCSVACWRELKRRQRIDDWLKTGIAENVSGSRAHFVRSYILADQTHRCAICGTGSQWNDAPLVFVLDHIDGDSSNNARANLRLICPNCDSQLPTFKGRNRGKGRHSRRERYAAGKSF